MKHIVVTSLFVSLLILAFTVRAEDSAAETLTGRLAEMRSFKSDFKQITLDGRGDNVQEVDGVIAVKRPGLFYWKTEPPFEQLLVSDGEKVWLYDPDLEQVTVQALDPRVSQTPALLLSGNVKDLTASYEITGMQTDELSVFELTPKDPESLFEQLKLSFANGQLVQMHLNDSLGQRSSFEFLNPEMNIELSAELFQFTPPDGVDVISQ